MFQRITAAVSALLLFAVLVLAIYPANWGNIGQTVVATGQLGAALFSPSGYGFTLLVLGVLLGGSMIGGVYLAKEE